MKTIIKNTLERVARVIPLALYPRLLPRERVDFFYHAVTDAPMTHARHLYPVVPVAQFEENLRYLKARYTLVSYEELPAHYAEGAPLPSNAAHLSFDDGFRECFDIVRPLLLKYEIPCTFFVATDWVDNHIMFYRNKVSLCIEHLHAEPEAVTRLHALNPDLDDLATAVNWLKELRLPDDDVINEVCRILGVDWEAFLAEYQPYLTRAQIQQMRAEGFTIGAHTQSHRKLRGLSATEIETEMVQSCRIVREISGQEIVPFSFPHSAFGVTRSLLADIRARHPFIGLLFDTKGVRRDVDFILNRVWAERPLEKRSSGGAGSLSPLPQVLHYAYQEAWVDEILGLGRKLRRAAG